MEEKKIVYFPKPGGVNTAACLNIVKSEVQDNGYKYVIVASATGETGAVFADALKDMGASLMVISYGEDGKEDLMEPANRQRILDKGATLFSAPVLSESLDRSFGEDSEQLRPSRFISSVLSIFGEGMKVCCQSAAAAVDGGLIPEGLEVICVAGTGTGADTVSVIRAMSTKRFRELRVREILARPR